MARTFQTEFDQFWRQTCGKVRAYMFCASNSASDADDLAQECYLRAFRNWDRFDERAAGRRGCSPSRETRRPTGSASEAATHACSNGALWNGHPRLRRQSLTTPKPSGGRLAD